MEKTQEEINAFMEILKAWGLLEKLTTGEVGGLKQRLHDIAGCAVMDVQRANQLLITNMYSEIRK
jgi:hypothetical protein